MAVVFYITAQSPLRLGPTDKTYYHLLPLEGGRPTHITDFYLSRDHFVTLLLPDALLPGAKQHQSGGPGNPHSARKASVFMILKTASFPATQEFQPQHVYDLSSLHNTISERLLNGGAISAIV